MLIIHSLQEVYEYVDISSFDCGNHALNEYLKKYAKQDVNRYLAKCFLATSNDNTLIGYYTLSSLSMLVDDIPQELISYKLPYRQIPMVLLGRLAVDKRFQGQGFGSELLVDAMKKVLDSPIGAFAILVRPKDENAKNFYAYHGFKILPDNIHMIIPVKVYKKLFQL